MPELSWAEIVVRLALAAVLGGAVGAERELRDRGAGFRTHLLVSVGAALFTMVSAYAWTDWTFSNRSGLVFDPTRIAAQVVSGIGFLGAGAIIRQGFSVRGLTTAATLWVVAAIGMASAVGYFEAAIVTTLLVLLTLWPLRILAHRIISPHRAAHGVLVVDVRSGAGSSEVVTALERGGAQVQRLDFGETDGTRRLHLELQLAPGVTAARVVAGLLAVDDVLGAEWTD
jgi:putative Mg2+ transporter-C (MgtC) family protein